MAISPTVADNRIKPIIFFNAGGIIHLIFSNMIWVYKTYFQYLSRMIVKRANIILCLSVFIWAEATASLPENEVAFVLSGVVSKVDGDSLSLQVENGAAK